MFTLQDLTISSRCITYHCKVANKQVELLYEDLLSIMLALATRRQLSTTACPTFTIETGGGIVTSFVFCCSSPSRTSLSFGTNLTFLAFLSTRFCPPRFLLNAGMFSQRAQISRSWNCSASKSTCGRRRMKRELLAVDRCYCRRGCKHSCYH